jgi:hypothetical protein
VAAGVVVKVVEVVAAVVMVVVADAEKEAES